MKNKKYTGINKQLLFLLIILIISSSVSSQTYFNLAGGDVTHSGANLVLEDANIVNDGTFTSTGSVSLTGSVDTSIEGISATTFNNLIIDKTSSNITLGNSVTIANDLDITNGKVILQDNDLTFNTSATISDYGDDAYIVTGGLGTVIKNDLSSAGFEFPVGYDELTYNPIEIIQNGTVDNISVRCLENVLEEGATGSIKTTDVIDVSWDINEATLGGSNLDLILQWEATDELSGFDNSANAVANYDGAGWNLIEGDLQSTSGSDPYVQVRLGVTETGYFTVGSQGLVSIYLSPIVLLQGSFVDAAMGTTDLIMRDDLRVAGLLPTTSPYSDGATCDVSVFNEGGTSGTGAIDDDIVDWVWLELRDENDTSIIIDGQSALLQRDGDVVAIDGLSSLSFNQASSNYYIVINHRNHLGIMSANAITLSASTTLLDLSSNPSSVTGSSNAVVDMGGGIYAMYSGDFDEDGQVLNSDIVAILALSGTAGYSKADANMD